MIYKASITLLLFLFTASAVSAAGEPNWVKNQSVTDDNAFISATGAADSLEQAKNRALANLSKIFEARINASTVSQIDTQVNIENLKEKFTRKSQLSQNIHVQSDIVIKGAEISEIWHDEKLRLYHALAVLNRAHAKNNLYDEIMRIDAETRVLLARSDLDQDIFQSITSLDKAIQLQEQRLSLQQMLKIIDIHGLGDVSEWNLQELRIRQNEKLHQLTISAVVENDDEGQLRKILVAAMGNAGFPAVDNASVVLQADLNVNDLGLQQGWYWLRARLDLQLLKNNTVIGSREFLFKVSALNHNDTKSRLMTLIRNRLNKDLHDTVLQLSSGAGARNQ